MKSKDEQKQHSEEQMSTELREILSKPPSFIIGYGTIIIVAFIILLLSASFFIIVPETIQGEAIITSVKKTDVVTGSVKNEMQYLAIIQIPVSAIEKFKEGQQVNFTLRKFPEPEMTKFNGVISSVLQDSGSNIANVSIKFSPDVSCNMEKLSNELGETRATAATITTNKKLIERIPGPLSKFFSNSP